MGLDDYFARVVAPSLPAAFVADHAATLSAVGDLMPHPYLTASRESLYRDVADVIFDADLAMANLECVVLDAPPELVVDLEAGPPVALDRAAFDVAAGHFGFLATASNHSLDFLPDAPRPRSRRADLLLARQPHEPVLAGVHVAQRRGSPRRRQGRTADVRAQRRAGRGRAGARRRDDQASSSRTIALMVPSRSSINRVWPQPRTTSMDARGTSRAISSLTAGGAPRSSSPTRR